MKSRHFGLAVTVALSIGLIQCGRANDEPGETGSAEIALTQAPSDSACLRITVTGGGRTVVKLFGLTPGQSSVFKMQALPVGPATFKGDAFASACGSLSTTAIPTWVSDPVVASIQIFDVIHVVLKMIHNGRVSVGVDFDEKNGGSLPPGGETGGTFSSASAYLLPTAPGVITKAILTVGDSPNLKPDGTPYRMVGIPDGLGAFDNGDGTFTLLANHELDGVGIVRAHGAKGAFVSRWIIQKSDLAVLKGEDLIKTILLWNPTTSSYAPGVTTFARFCSADLAPRSAFFDAATGLGTEARLFISGEESGLEGRVFAHGMDGTSTELPRLGKLAWENAVASPAPGIKTVVGGTDDGTGGNLYFYVGTKNGSGTDVEKAGLTNGTLYGLKVTGVAAEDAATGIPSGPFTLDPLGNVENLTGAMLDAVSNAAGHTHFLRPEDAAWDPSSPNDFYFVTTASFTGSSRLWRLRFVDATNPTLGGKIEMMLDGSEGQKMMDNIAIDKFGHILIQEDVGAQDHIGRMFRYDIATDTLTAIVQHDPARFAPGAPMFLTRDEESSGVIDASDILGPGWFLADVQAHYTIAGELAEGGQLLAIYDPATAVIP